MEFNQIINFLTDKEMTAFATIATIIGFFMTLYVTFTIKKIRNFYFFAARVPEIVKNLRAHNSKVSSHLNSFTVISDEIIELLINIEVELYSLNKKVDSDIKKQSSSIIKDIQNVNGSQKFNFKIINLNSKNDCSPEKSLQNIYLSIYKLIKMCETKSQDDKWEQQ